MLGKVKSLDEIARRRSRSSSTRPPPATRSRSCCRPRGLLDAVRVGPIRKQAHDVVDSALRSRALPGDAGDAARGDTGERGHRHRVRDRGSRRRRARTRRREPVLRAAPGRTSTTSVDDLLDDARSVRRFVSEREAHDLAARGRVPRRAPRGAARADRTARATGCRFRRSSCRSCSRPTSAVRSSTCSPARSRAGSSSCDARRSTSSSTIARRACICCGSGGVGKTTTAAVLALEGARRGRNTCVVTIDPAKRLADALGLEALTERCRPRSTATRWDDDRRRRRARRSAARR